MNLTHGITADGKQFVTATQDVEPDTSGMALDHTQVSAELAEACEHTFLREHGEVPRMDARTMVLSYLPTFVGVTVLNEIPVIDVTFTAKEPSDG